MLAGQIMVFHIQREFTLQSLGWTDFDGPRRRLVKDILRAHTRSALGFPMQPTGAESHAEAPYGSAEPGVTQSGEPGTPGDF
jgi:hypothetical protein